MKQYELPPILATFIEKSPQVDWVDLNLALDQTLSHTIIRLNPPVPRVSAHYVIPDRIILDGFSIVYDGISITIPAQSETEFGVLVERRKAEFLGNVAQFITMLCNGQIVQMEEPEILEQVATACEGLENLLNFGFKTMEDQK